MVLIVLFFISILFIKLLIIQSKVIIFLVGIGILSLAAMENGEIPENANERKT